MRFRGIFLIIGLLQAVEATAVQPVMARALPGGSVSLIQLPAGVEGRVLHLERLFDRDWVYVAFINGPYRGQKGWLPFRGKANPIRLYGLEQFQAYQTLDVRKAAFARTHRPAQAYLDFRLKGDDAGQSSDDVSAYMVDFFSFYPRSNFGIESVEHLTGINSSCPERPIQRNGSPCLAPPEKFTLPAHLKKLIRNVAREEKVHPALLAAILQKESYFNPFSENKYEKNFCTGAELAKGKCTDYRWGQGLAQLGKTNAKDYGLLWQEKLFKPKACGRRHIFEPACFQKLENYCKVQSRKNGGLYPANCPTAGVRAAAKHIAEFAQRSFWLRVDSKAPDGSWKEGLIDARKFFRRSLAEEFRYILGMYNRGMRPLNSLEEHFRQHGKAPEWYDSAWLVERVEGVTPSPQMGYLLLNKEMINRCHVWQLAGLCGTSMRGTLAGQYLEDFPENFAEFEAKDDGERSPAGRVDAAETLSEISKNPYYNVDSDLLELETRVDSF